jgi:CMP/dCMP kinase
MPPPHPNSATVVLAISRQIGSGGTYIGRAVAGRLGLKYADREIVQEAARLLGVKKNDVTLLEERMSSRWVRLARIFAIGPPESPYVPPRLPALDEGVVFEVESRIVRDLAQREDAVIVGRGAFHALRHHPGAIRVFVHAPEAWRVERIMRVYNMKDEEAARALVQRSDTSRCEGARRITGGFWFDATRFDLCLNAASVGLGPAIDLVAGIVSRRLEARSAGESR